MAGTEAVIDWILESGEPWTRCRTRVDLLGEDVTQAKAASDRREMLEHPQIKGLIEEVGYWEEAPLTRHNDSAHPLHKLALLAEFGLKREDNGLAQICEKVMRHQSEDGFFMTLENIPTGFGGTGLDTWTWILCDAPLLISSLLSFGYGDDRRLKQALEQLIGMVAANGYLCAADSSLGKFRGPGRKGDPCPIANLLTLRAFSFYPDTWDKPAVENAAEMLLGHWDAPVGQKYYLFGIGSDFRKIKAPLIWYDLLHVCDTLSRFPHLRADPRLKEMTQTLFDQADEQGRFTATSMYKAWSDWSFADKKRPSPWLTFLALRIRMRMQFDPNLREVQ